MMDLALFTNPGLYGSRLPYDTERDFAPIGLVARVPIVLVLGPKLQGGSWDAVLAAARANPGGIDVATPAIGSTAHFALELLNHATGAQLSHVPYRGGGSMMADLIAGTFDAALLEFSTALPLHSEGKARILAVAAERRTPQVPEVPTFIEQGMEGFEAASWGGVLAPAGTPEPIVRRYHAELARILAMPDVREKLAGLGAEVVGGSPEEFAAYIRSEIDKWGQAVRASGATPEG
jgi:tripartite-type tricarboxylate transporter receptor subunit TctC